MNTDCIFCRIISGEIPGDILYQDDDVIAFRDINPQAPIHILVMPKAHIPSLAEITIDHRTLMGHMVFVASEMAKSEGISALGYRLVINSGPESGQEVPHLHLHLLGGRVMGNLG
ncbi:MAG: HIT domain-containing protein [Dehalococcoidia bacterium]|nr:HIT domain-containing protein [Dehalococcoidia bacterium]